MATIFPNELWMSVFEELDSPRDIAYVVRTSKRFKSLALRVLYRHIVWSDPIKFVGNHSFLQENPSLRSVTRTLTLGISTATPQLDRVEQISRARATVFLTGDIVPIHRPIRGHEARILDEAGVANSVDLIADVHATDAMYNHAFTFTNLRDLTFNNMVLPDFFYAFVHRFPVLDRLAIENCTPPLRPQPTDLHPRDLPITELTIVGLRGRRDPCELRAFGEAQYLRIVRFDWTCYIHKHFAGFNPNITPNNWQNILVLLPPGAPALPDLNAIQALNIPHVHQPIIPIHHDPVPSPHMHTIDVKFPTQKSWQTYISEPHDQLINPFTNFLSKCPHVANLRIRNYLPWLRLSNTALPNLVYYQGPLTTIKPIVCGSRRLKHLTIRDPAGGLVALEKAFKDIEASGNGADLESLSVFIGWWDDEILYAILHHFSGLKRLEIMYKEGDPSDESMLGMGAHFFGMMPHLWSVRVFRAIPPAVDNTAHRSIVGEVIGADGPERVELDDAEFEEAKSATASFSPSYIGWAAGLEESEEILLKEYIQAWNRYCPMLREIQLKAGYVWRRAGPDDAWTQRATRVSRVRNAGFEEV